MHLLAQEEYGLRCMLQVARSRGEEPLTIPQIAGAEGLSSEYTAKLMRALRQGGLVVSTRGAGGGYRLARPAHEITAWEVLEVLGGPIFPDSFCETHPGQRRDCIHSTNCSVRALWRTVEHSVRGVLDRITLADLHKPEPDMVVWLSDPSAARATPPSPDGPRPAPDRISASPPGESRRLTQSGPPAPDIP
jgi:Rrf2 family protein